MERRVPPSAYATFDEWREATQRYQALVVKRHIEELRRLKYRPTGGFCQFAFADGQPGITWSVLGHDRAPKLGHAALVAACAPVIVVADRLPAQLRPGQGITLDVHVVSDLRRPLGDIECRARLSWVGGAHEWGFAGDIPADACVRVGALQLEAPGTPGPLALDLELTGPGLPGPVTNHDATIVLDDR
jgi:beta-mannosidase